MEIELTWKQIITVWWSFFWRNILAILCAVLISTAVSAVLAIITVALGIPKDTLKAPAMVIGAMLGLAASIIPIKYILNKSYKGFRISIVAEHHEHKA